MGHLLIIVTIILNALFLGHPSRADITIPTITKVYFEKAGQPYRYPVDFTVTCYGTRWRPGAPPETQATGAPLQNVYSFSAACPDYGCEIHENYYLNYRKIEYCNVEGKAVGVPFKIEKFAKTPTPDCQYPGQGKFERSCTLKFALP